MSVFFKTGLGKESHSQYYRDMANFPFYKKKEKKGVHENISACRAKLFLTLSNLGKQCSLTFFTSGISWTEMFSLDIYSCKCLNLHHLDS